MYNTLYELINQTIFNGLATGYEDMICTIVATASVLFVIALPFVIVLKVVKMICG